MARLLVANEQGGPLAQLVVDPMQPPKYRTLGAIVVHTAAVFLCQQRVAILQPFVDMLKSPATLVVGTLKFEITCIHFNKILCCYRMPFCQQCLKTTA